MTTTAERVVDLLNAYTGDNFWQDIIVPAGVDDMATEAADPHSQSEVAIFLDGSQIYFREDDRKWYTSQN